MTSSSYLKQIFRTSSCKSVPEEHSKHNGSSAVADNYRNRDSGTSSPQHETSAKLPPLLLNNNKLAKGTGIPPTSIHIDKKTRISMNVDYLSQNSEQEDESDSNDSVFSSGSSTDSNLGGEAATLRNRLEIRDIYLGGSCMLRTTWRIDFAIPYLNQKGVTFHLPILHESIRARVNTASGGSVVADLNDPILEHEIAAENSQKQPTENTKKSTLNKLRIWSNLNVTPDSSPDDQPSHQFSHYDTESVSQNSLRKTMFNPQVLDASRVLLFVITNETRSLAPMTLAAHYIGLGYNVVLCVQMLPDFCIIGNDKVMEIPFFIFKAKNFNIFFSLADIGCNQGLQSWSCLLN